MKVKLMTTTIAMLFTVNSFAGFDNFVSKMKRDGLSYGLPCLVSYGLSFALLKDKQAEIGTIGCATSASLNYIRIQDRNKMEEQFSINNKESLAAMQKQVESTAFKNVKDSMVNDIHKEVYVKVEDSMLKDSKFKSELMAGLTAELKEYKAIIDNVLALKLAEFKKEIPKEVESQLMNGPFLKLVEDKVNKSFKDKFVEAIDSKREAIVKQCVSEALDEIIVKQVGAKDAGLKVLEKK